MIIDQAEINALLAEADGLAAETSAEMAREVAPPAQTPRPRPLSLPNDPQLARLMRLRVPVIVQLAHRPMPISNVRSLSVGAILEFEKSVEDELDLLINNRLVGHGTCVKVGENFGLRITQICERVDRILSMGG